MHERNDERKAEHDAAKEVARGRGREVTAAEAGPRKEPPGQVKKQTSTGIARAIGEAKTGEDPGKTAADSEKDTPPGKAKGHDKKNK